MSHRESRTPFENASEILKNYMLTQREIDCLEHYLKFDTWNVREALCLLCSLDPRTTDVAWDAETKQDAAYERTVCLWGYFDSEIGEYVEILDDSGMPRSEYRPDAEIYLRLHETEGKLRDLKRMWDARLGWKEGKDRFTPSEYVSWAVSKNKLHIKWLDWATDRGYFTGPQAEISAVTRANKEGDDTSAKTKNFLLQIIGGLIATKKLDIRFSGGRMQGVKGIMHSFDKLELALDRGKLSRYLKDAIELLPESVQEDLRKADTEIKSS